MRIIARYILTILVSFCLNGENHKRNFLVDNSNLRVGYWSSWNIKCGIAIYTKNLYVALKKAGHSVFVYPHTLSPNELLEQVKQDGIQVLNIQYEPGILPSTEVLLPLIQNLRVNGIKVVAIVHYESNDMHRLIHLFDQCIYHKPSLFFEETGKINMVHHGVPVFEPPLIRTQEFRKRLRVKYGFNTNDIILTTTGFMANWKQFGPILEFLVPWLKSNPNHKVQLLTSYNTFTPELCAVEHAKVRDVVEKYQLKAQVIHITKFLDQKELSRRLYISDLGYLWAGMDTRSVSGAAAQFIAARLPTVVTDSTHYMDLVAGTIRTPKDPEIFVATIEQTIKDTSLRRKLRTELELCYHELNYNNIIKAHLKVFKKQDEGYLLIKRTRKKK